MAIPPTIKIVGILAIQFMNKLRLFYRNVSILFDYLPEHFKNLIIHSLKSKKDFFKLSRSPKIPMYSCIILSIIFTLLGKVLLAIIFIVLYIVFWMLKVWEGGEPMKRYKEKHLIPSKTPTFRNI